MTSLHSPAARLTAFVQNYYFATGKMPVHVAVHPEEFEVYCSLVNLPAEQSQGWSILTCGFGTKLVSDPEQPAGQLRILEELPALA